MMFNAEGMLNRDPEIERALKSIQRATRRLVRKALASGASLIEVRALETYATNEVVCVFGEEILDEAVKRAMERKLRVI